MGVPTEIALLGRIAATESAKLREQSATNCAEPLAETVVIRFVFAEPADLYAQPEDVADRIVERAVVQFVESDATSSEKCRSESLWFSKADIENPN